MELQQILAAFAANPQLKDQLLESLANDASTFLTGKKNMVVKSKDDYDNELSVRDQETIRKALAGETGNLWTGVESIIETLYGIKKPDGMKVPAWIKQLEADDMFPVDPKSIKEKLKKLKEGKGSEGGNPTESALVTQLRAELDTLRTEQTNKEKKAFERLISRTIEVDLRGANVPLPTALKDNEKDAAKAQAIGDLVAVFSSLYEGKEDASGNLYFVKRGTDTALMNTTTSKPMTPLDIVKANHKSLLAVEGYQQQGAGTIAPTGGQGSGQITTKSLQQIKKEAFDQGLAVYSDPWNKYVTEEAQKAGIKIS